MLLRCDLSTVSRYTSQAQKSRVLSERWFQSYGYCLACDSDSLIATTANTKATDFICPLCNQNYELKAFQSRPTRTLVDGAYGSLMSRVLNGTVPTLMMLERSHDWEIRSLTAIHHLFLTPNVIEQRKPLSPTARRAGWVGCNIRIDRIAEDALIKIVQAGRPNEPRVVRDSFRKFEKLKAIDPRMRGWTTLTLQVIHAVRKIEFTLADLYEREGRFAGIYPENRNIRAKIRQQLQTLRDFGYLEFRGKGMYRLLI